MSEVLIQLFEQSHSYSDARTRISYLEKLETWDTSFSVRILSAARDNSQISDSYGVKERIDALVKKRDRTGL